MKRFKEKLAKKTTYKELCNFNISSPFDVMIE